MTPQIDYKAAFENLPGAAALLSPDFVILDVNDCYLDAAGRGKDEIVGRNIIEAFPGNPGDPDDTGPRELRDSLEAVLATGMPDFMDPTRYDVEDAGHPGEFEERHWAVANAPVCDPDGKVTMIIHMPQEVTHIVRMTRATNA